MAKWRKQRNGESENGEIMKKQAYGEKYRK